MLFISIFSSKRGVLYWLVMFSFLISVSCFFDYYRIKQTDLNSFKEQINSGKIKQSRYYVMHYRDSAMHLSNPYFQQALLHGELFALSPARKKYIEQVNKAIRYRPHEKHILQEVHFVIRDDAPITFESGSIAFPDSTIEEVYVYGKDQVATISSHVASIVLPIAVGVLIVYESASNIPIGFSGGSSCPHVYANDGQTFRRQGELFANAIFPQLERHDFLPLPDIQIVDGGYQLQIANVQPELQHINLTSLMVVEHPDNSRVLLDQHGKAYSIHEPQPPLMARSPNGRDLRTTLRGKDRLIYRYDEGEELQNYVELAFAKPDRVTKGKLILNLAGSHWTSAAFEAFTSRLGDQYQEWAAQMSARPASEIYNIMDMQGLRPALYQWVDGGWQLVERIHSVGPVALREFVLPIDLKAHTGTEIRLRLTGGQLFWDLDYAAMDFSADEITRIKSYSPAFAIASDGREYTRELAADDREYLHQQPGGNQVSLLFPAPPVRSGYRQSVFLHSKGYYEHIRDYDGPPLWSDLPQMDKPDAFIQFSKDQYQLYREAYLGSQ